MSIFQHSRELPAPPAVVFAAIQDPVRLARWWGPDGFTNTFRTFEFRPGGSWHFTMHGPDGVDHPNESAFLEIVPNSMVRIRHVNLPHFDLSIALEPTANGTLVSWVGVFENPEFAANARAFLEVANEQNLDRLAREVRAGQSKVTIHMAASVDGFIARADGRVDWLETSDTFEPGDTMTPEFVQAFLETIDCYVMGSRTYETALAFEAGGLGWAYGDKPTFVLTRRELRKTRDSVEFYAGDLPALVNGRLKPHFGSIWFVGGGELSGECLRLGLADEVRYSIMPILIGGGIPFFKGLDTDVALHLIEAKTYRNGMVGLRYEIRREAHGATAHAPGPTATA